MAREGIASAEVGVGVGVGKPTGGAVAPQRSRHMALLREQGYTLDQIARAHGVSRERVRQLLGRLAVPDAGEVAHARRSRAEQQALARVDELLVLWRAGGSAAGAASALGLQAASCRRVIARHATDADRAARRARLASARTRTQTYTDGDIIRALRHVAARLDRAPGAKEYAALTRELGCPSLPTVLNRMGGWTAALQAAGLSPAGTRPRPRTRRWTADACWAALRQAVAELGAIPTVAGYDRHARGRDDLPSPATIRNRLGRWSTITTRLAADAMTPRRHHAGAVWERSRA
jgi:hypothetical protein